MPIYEYTCRKCNAHVEVMQKISDPPLTRHAKCGGKLEKEWSRTGFQFKGTGWYVTDYAGKKTETKDSSASSGAKSEASSSDAKSGSDAKSDGAEKKSSEKTKAGKSKGEKAQAAGA